MTSEYLGLLDMMRCPVCHAALRDLGVTLDCINGHQFPCNGPFLVFDAGCDPGKYTKAYAERYAFLWAYGFETRRSGLVESLYRSVEALAAEALAESSMEHPMVVECGCGSGRSISDVAQLAPQGKFLGVDVSAAKLELAASILLGDAPVEASSAENTVLPDYGFGALAIAGRGLKNVVLAQADAMNLPLKDHFADMVLSVNLLDRITNPAAAIQEAKRILRNGGALVMTTPLNWLTRDLWREYPDAQAIVRLIEKCGFTISTWYDGLLYREVLDKRNSVEEFSTFVISARSA